MTDEDGQPLIEPTHVLDAAVVAAAVFFTLLLGDAVPAIIVGEGAYITVRDIMFRLPTAGVAFGLVLFLQWARYRGVSIRQLTDEDE